MVRFLKAPHMPCCSNRVRLNTKINWVFIKINGGQHPELRNTIVKSKGTKCSWMWNMHPFQTSNIVQFWLTEIGPFYILNCT